MRSAESAGRIIGLLMPLQMAFGLILPFLLIQGPLSIVPPGFFVDAAANALQIRLAVLIAFVGGALAVGIAITAYPVIRRYSQTMALWLLALCVVSLAMDAIHNTAAGATDTGLFVAIGMAVRSIRY